MRPVTPVTRITIGLVLLTVSILFAGNLIGLTPDTTRATLEARQRFCEALAVQLSMAVSENNLRLVENTIAAVVERDPAVLSAALRKIDGTLLAETREHELHWQATRDESSTPSHVQVPIFKGPDRWGTVEISFTTLQGDGIAGLLGRPFVRLLIFMTLCGSLVYYILLKKALKYLDPSSVIPGRVKAALDVLAEGVVLMDDHGRIVLANAAFASKVGANPASLLGTRLVQFAWRHPKDDTPVQRLPWEDALQGGHSQTGIPMRLRRGEEDVLTLMVNSAPILDGQGKPRGTLTTFDDVTQLERQNVQLEEMLRILRDSQDRVHRQNEQLQILATRDSLTECLNRRALFQKLDEEFAETLRTGKALCCLMCDIDHFKAINDRHGHVHGDRVIRAVAQALNSLTRDSDTLGRYGGEEFCILLPRMSLQNAAETAERLRQRIAALDIGGVRVTASFGLAATTAGTREANQLIQEADSALYRAKNSGRNRVVVGDEPQAPHKNVS
ncbi:MAG: GGDEF domain-containing protein [Gammaproteobacteria bacterium]|nr:MAG: GGDEF domain-containing protein [Gammaproteobacteria bacterium]